MSLFVVLSGPAQVVSLGYGLRSKPTCAGPLPHLLCASSLSGLRDAGVCGSVLQHCRSALA